MMLSDPGERMDSMSLLTYMAPIAALSLIPPALYFESGALANAMVLGKSGGEAPLLPPPRPPAAAFPSPHHLWPPAIQKPSP
jgi:hypothetical protein